jgi:hypothetical protein
VIAARERRFACPRHARVARAHPTARDALIFLCASLIGNYSYTACKYAVLPLTPAMDRVGVAGHDGRGEHLLRAARAARLRCGWTRPRATLSRVRA